jgi:sugar/nucleoside kinase (ribokinase family)
MRTAIERIKARGGTLSFDPNLRSEVLDAPGLRTALSEVLVQADVFLPSGEELYLFTEAHEEAAAVQELSDRGVGDIVVKRGNQGASHYNRTGRIDVTAHLVHEVDPTGAGDCFGATFVSFWLSGSPPAVSLRYANAAGAHAVTKLGPMEGAATREQLDALLAQAQG